MRKEEAKTHSFCETPEEKCTMNYCDENGCQNRNRVLVEEAKQETLEEANEFKYYFENDIEMFEFINEIASTGKVPKKWSLFVSKINDLYKQEQMYSEKDLREAYNASEDGWVGFDFWFEQFKNK